MSPDPSRLARTASLPPHANLEHLKNEAKQRLKTMRSQNPGARLSEAQLNVARGYGFASWRRLKSYVDALKDVGQKLVNAVHAGDLGTIREILDRHPELVNASTDPESPLTKTWDGKPAPADVFTRRLIHLAVMDGKGDALRLLIERGADMNVRDGGGRLPLHDCFELSHDDLAKILFEAGAVADICAAAAFGMHERLREILTQDPSQANDLTTRNSPLGWAVYGAQPVSATILFEHGAVVDRSPFDSYAWGPAAMVASTAVTPVLLGHGANPNWQNEVGDTAMHCAIKSRIVLDPTKFIQLLLKSGADVSIRNHEGRTALDEALLQLDKTAENYFPVRPIAQKKLDQTIEILRSRLA
ncbi:MAG TPA: ankyrin repeat domain-containing protein [Terriglobales bacterium]|nr:ankyrin repeat domain-containing protein [Terriglobales bacterium]